jgi:hypothetical protein
MRYLRKEKTQARMGFEGESKSGFKLLDLKINFQLVHLKTPIKIMETTISSFQTLKKIYNHSKKPKIKLN